MFAAVAINASPARRQYTHAVAVNSGMVTMQYVTDTYPDVGALARTFHFAKPDVVLLDLDDPTESLHLFKEMQRHYPETPAIGIGGTPAQRQQMQLAGVASFVPYNSTELEFQHALAGAIRAKAGSVIPHLFAFLPAKAGCGASTIALAAAASMARGSERGVLCVDADLRSGVMELMTGLEAGTTTQGALASADQMDQFRWTGTVRSKYGVDFLLSSGSAAHPMPLWNQYFDLLRFVETRYGAILVDLPELVNGATEEVVRRAHSVFVVTTQEVVSLKLAKRRLEELADWGVPEDRLKLLVNRWHKRDTANEDISLFIGRPVAATFPNDYPLVRSSLLDSAFPFPTQSPLGRAVADFADSLVSRPAQGAAPPAGLFGRFRELVSKT